VKTTTKVNCTTFGTITAGKFAGLKWTGSPAYGFDTGSCTKSPMSLASIQLPKGMKLTIS
jgi:hypothetical protein